MTLEQALDAEGTTLTPTLMAMLTPVAKSIEEYEMKEIMKGTSSLSYKITDLHSIREFCSYRIRHGLPVFPYPDMELEDEHFPPSY